MAKLHLHSWQTTHTSSRILRISRSAIMQEKVGFTVMSGGIGTWLSSMMANLDFGQVIGIIVAVVGVMLQLLAFIRNSRESKERMAREKEEHQLKIEMMKIQIAEAKE